MLVRLQPLSGGSGTQETENVLLEKFAKVRVVEPLWPGAEIAMVEGFAVTVGVAAETSIDRLALLVAGGTSESVTVTEKSTVPL